MFSQNPCCNYTDTGNQPGSDGETFGIALGDGDGNNDAVVVDAYDDMEVYINNSSGIFLYDETYGSGKSWFGVDLVDVDLDYDLDIIVAAFYSGAGCEVWLNDGMGNFSFSQGSIASSISMLKLGIGDLNGNGHPDIFAPVYSGSSSQAWYNDGNASFTAGFQINNNNYAKAIKISDIDYDCDYDVIIESYGSNGVQVWTNDGLGEFSICF